SDAELEALRRRGAEEREAERQRRDKEAETLRLQFRDLATQILGEQSQRFRQTSQESIDILLKPFRDNIAEFRKRVEEIYTTQTSQRGELKNELQRLMELNRTISADAQNLTDALRGNSKVQGDWGEMLLETILSNSNLVRGIHYQTQDTQKDETGANVRPDVILNLPDRKQIVIDSKTSLTAFAAYTSCESAEESKQYLRNHIESVRKHVAELASKNYQALMNCSPDFVIMFIPNEPAFLAALQNDPSIWADAYKKKVIISSPTNIFALLKLVDNLWQRNDLERNTREIADCGSKIYDQLVAFTDALTNVDRGLKQAQKAYDDAYKRFTIGNSNLVRLGERMVGLHIKIRKGQSKQVLDTAELDDPAATATLSPVTSKEKEEDS
ncbi:MAG: DNA recombination protein RmuC, partial [Alistipes sp.]|nr:DNA recombination protein RmuC [Alistipes sp.]